MSYHLVSARARLAKLDMGDGKLADRYPNLWAYVELLQEEAGYKKAAAKVEKMAGTNLSIPVIY